MDLTRNYLNNNQINKIDTNNLYEIVEDLPGLKVKDIEFCAPVYYPIAEVSVNFKERNFEDFEAVEQLILNLYKLGVSSPDILSKTLGIPKNYIKQTLKVLEGYGFIDLNSTTLTKEGELSLKKGRKIYTHDVEQIFQLDLLNKQLLKIDDRIKSSNLKLLTKTYKERSTYNEKGHLDFNDNTDDKKLIEQINNNFDNLVKRSSETLRKIPERINKVTPISGFKYVDSYMLLIKNFDNPIVVARRYNPTAKEFRKRNVWKPLGVNKPEEAKFLELEGVNVNTIEATNYIIKLFNLITEQPLSKSNKLEELYQVYPFNQNGILGISSQGFKDIIQIDRNFFEHYDPFIFELLQKINEEGEFLIVRPKLYGQIISLTTNDQTLYDLYSYYHEGVAKLGSKKLLLSIVVKELNGNSQNIEEIIRIINKIISN